jgi:hypothetical protein
LSRTDEIEAMRQLAFQIIDVLMTLLRVQGTESAEGLKAIVIFCGTGLDASLLCLANGWI